MNLSYNNHLSYVFDISCVLISICEYLKISILFKERATKSNCQKNLFESLINIEEIYLN